MQKGSRRGEQQPKQVDFVQLLLALQKRDANFRAQNAIDARSSSAIQTHSKAHKSIAPNLIQKGAGGAEQRPELDLLNANDCSTPLKQAVLGRKTSYLHAVFACASTGASSEMTVRKKQARLKRCF